MLETVILLGKLALATVTIIGVVYGIVSSMLSAHRRSFEELSKEMRAATAAQSSQWRQELADAKGEHKDIASEARMARAVAGEVREKQAVLEAQFMNYKGEVDRLRAMTERVHERIDKAEDARERAAESLALKIGEMTEAIRGLQNRRGAKS